MSSKPENRVEMVNNGDPAIVSLSKSKSTDIQQDTNNQNIMVQFFTHISDPKYIIEEDMSLSIPTSADRMLLSKIVKSLLNLDILQPFDFLIKGEYLRGPVSKYLTAKGLTNEEILELEYTIACIPSRPNVLQSNCDWVASVKWIPDTNIVLSGGFDGTLRGFRVPHRNNRDLDDTMEMEENCYPNEGPAAKCFLAERISATPIASISAIQNPNYPDIIECVIGLKDGSILFDILNIQQRNRIRELERKKAHLGGGCATDIHENDRTIASGGWDGIINIWKHPIKNLESTQVSSILQIDDGLFHHKEKKRRESNIIDEELLRCQINGHNLPVTDVKFGSGNGSNYLFSSSMDGTARAWDILTGTSVLGWKTDRAAISLAVAPECKVVATAHEDGYLRVWDLRNASHISATEKVISRLTTYPAHNGMATTVRWHPTSEHLLSSTGLDGYLTISDIRSLRVPLQRTLATEIKNANPVRLLTCAWGAHQVIYTGASDGIIREHPMQLYLG